MREEYLDIVSENNQGIGQESRRIVHKSGSWHREKSLSRLGWYTCSDGTPENQRICNWFGRAKMYP